MPSNADVVAEYARWNGYRLITHTPSDQRQLYCLLSDEGPLHELHQRTLEDVAFHLLGEMNEYMTVILGGV